ncbi:MAG: hypothetical protein WCQ50_08465 [Spirochaetota bacterium]
MTVNMVKFGDILISRPAGREAFLAAKAYLFTENAGFDSIILDFKGVKVLAPRGGMNLSLVSSLSIKIILRQQISIRPR